MAAARELFTQHGFGGTTMAAIAQRAQVTPQTVYANFGSKGGIVAALLAQLEDEADAAEWQERIDAAPRAAAKLQAFAGWTRSILSTSRSVIAASPEDMGRPALSRLYALAAEHRRAALDGLVSVLADDLRSGMTTERAVDIAWLLTGVELYLNATDGCGWSDAEYEQWLAQSLVSQLLGHQ